MAIQELTEEIMTAIHAYRATHDVSDAEIARTLGITPQHLNKILKHTSSYIKSETWEKMKPRIKPYMACGNIISGGSNRGVTQISNSSDVSVNPESEKANIAVEKFRTVAILAVIDLEIDLTAKDAVLKALKSITVK